jgi:thiosulfate dehydrogenase [quinone] large subunit
MGLDTTIDGEERASSRIERIIAAPGGSLLLLRAFLGVTFTFAGLQKLANANFFSATAPGSFGEQLRGAIVTSPLHHLLDPALHAPTLIALLISLGEVSVGLGTLFGLVGRAAAFGGMLLSLSFFLTVSFNDNPYYYGADIVFFFAWTPLLLGGSGAWSLDALFLRRQRAAKAAMVLAAARNSSLVRRRAAELERRVVLQRLATIGAVAGAGALLGGIVAGLGRVFATTAQGGSNPAGLGTTTSNTPGRTSSSTPGSSSTPASTMSSGAQKGTRLGLASAVPVGGAASFTDPAQGVPAFVVQPTRGTFRAFSAVCTHAGCPVQFDGQNDAFVCPCHGSVFNASTGAVIQGPAPSPLQRIPITLGPGGELYVDA